MSPLAIQIFHCTELCEMIPLNLDVRSLLIARKASQIFEQTISSSTQLRRALFLEADDASKVIRLNPVLERIIREMGHEVSWEINDPNEQERHRHPPMALLNLYATLTVRVGEGDWEYKMSPRRLASRYMDEDLFGDMLISQPPILIDTVVKDQRTGFFVRGVKKQKDVRMREFLNSLLWILKC